MSKTATKWIHDNAVNEAKFRLSNDAYLRARNVANSADINILKLNSSDIPEFGVQPIFGGSQLVTKQYVDDVIAGVRDPKDAVRVASTANINLASPGASIDGIAMSAGNRFLAKDQTAPAENGIYIWNGAAVAATRSTDADADAEVTQGLSTDVIEGTVNGRTRWLLTTADPIVVGTTGLTFVMIPIPGAAVSFKRNVFVLNGTDITNGYVDLTNTAEHQSIMAWPDDGPMQRITDDFTLSNAGAGGVTRVTFAGDLLANLVATDVLIVNFAHF